jgi:hypothetical protein
LRLGYVVTIIAHLEDSPKHSREAALLENADALMPQSRRIVRTRSGSRTSASAS